MGIPVGESLFKKIEEWRKQHVTFGNLRWIERENLHLTLIPPWNVEDPTQVIERISHVSSFTPFTLSFHTLSFGPPRSPHLIWMTGSPSEELTILRKDIYSNLKKTMEKRAFLPHITIARFKAETFQTLSTQELTESVAWQMSVSEFVLYESILSPQGSKYKKISTANIL